jgi:hypothetical protein
MTRLDAKEKNALLSRVAFRACGNLRLRSYGVNCTAPAAGLPGPFLRSRHSVEIAGIDSFSGKPEL